jgi:hypothetical protein
VGFWILYRIFSVEAFRSVKAFGSMKAFRSVVASWKSFCAARMQDFKKSKKDLFSTKTLKIMSKTDNI